MLVVGLIVLILGASLWSSSHNPRLDGTPESNFQALESPATQLPPPENQHPLESAPTVDGSEQSEKIVPIWTLVRDGDAGELMARHWPKAKQGDGDSQLIVYTLMERCALYRKRFKGKQLDEVQADFSAHNDPELFMLNAEIWQRCGEIYESWDSFGGWRDMLKLAAENSQPIAMVQIGGDLVSNPKTHDDGVLMIETALQSQNPGAVAAMAGLYARRYDDRVTYESWLLAACRMGFDCALDIEGCERTACGRESFEEALLNELGDVGFYATKQRADEIYAAVASGNVQDLSISSDLRRD